MNKKDLEKLKKALEAEKETLESELGEIGMKDPNNSNNWDASTRNTEVDMADENEVANKIEEMQDNDSVVSELEIQLKNVKDALDKMVQNVALNEALVKSHATDGVPPLKEANEVVGLPRLDHRGPIEADHLGQVRPDHPAGLVRPGHGRYSTCTHFPDTASRTYRSAPL